MAESTVQIPLQNLPRGSIIMKDQFPSFTAINSPKGQKNRTQSIIVTIPHSGKQFHIHLDSPRTQLSMKQLGINLQNLQQKTLDSFGGSNVTEKIKQIRYDHYLDRLNQDYISIIRHRKEIIKREREQAIRLNDSINSNNNFNSVQHVKSGNAQSKDQQNNSISTKAQTATPGGRNEKQKPFASQTALKSNNRSSIDNLNVTNPLGNNNFKSIMSKNSQYRSFSESKVNPSHMSQVLEKTIKYLKQSHDSPEIYDGSQILGNGEENSLNQDQEYDPFESQMEKEIERYNKLKKQKQKEAKFVYLEDVKRQKILEDMANREKSIIEFKIKEEMKKQLKKEKDREKAIEKLEQIREYNYSKDAEKAKQKEYVMKKLESLKQKEQEQNIINEQELEEKRKLRRERNEKISRAKSECEMRNLKESQKMYRNYVVKMMESEDQYKSKLSEKQQRTRDRLSQEQQRLDQFLEEQQKQQKQNFSSFVERLYQKDGNFKKNIEKKVRDEIKVQQIKKDKQDRLRENQQSVYLENQERKLQLNNRFQKIEENRIQRKEDQIENSKIKQELRNLKLNYMHENFERQNRINDYKLEQMLEKERWHQDNISAIKNQRELIKEAKKQTILCFNVTQIIDDMDKYELRNLLNKRMYLIKDLIQFIIKQREVYNQYKAEGDRIYEGIKIIQENLFPTQIIPVKQASAHKGIRILKKIFKQDEQEQQELEDRLFPKKPAPTQQNNNTIGSQYILRDQ